MNSKITSYFSEALETLELIDWKVIAFDCETIDVRYPSRVIHGGSYETGKPTGISFCDGVVAIYIDTTGWEEIEVRTLMAAIQDKLSTTELLIGHNIVFDLGVLSHYNISCEHCKWFDTMTAAHLLDENRKYKGGLGLKTLAIKDLGYETVREYDDNNQNAEDFQEYGLWDSIYTYELYELYEPYLVQEDLEYLFTQIEMPFHKVLLQMDITGVYIDQPRAKDIIAKSKKQIVQYFAQMYDLLGVDYDLISKGGVEEIKAKEPINFNSNTQVAPILIARGVELTETTPTGKYKLSDDILEQIKDDEFVEVLRNYRKLRHVMSHFINKLPALVDTDGRIRPNWKNTGTVTGRLSSSAPNCLTADTEVLTKKGWKLGIDLSPDEEIAVFDKETQLLHWETPTKHYSAHSDDVWEFKTTRFSIGATGNHRHLVQNRKTNEWKVQEDGLKEDYRLWHSSIGWKQGKQEVSPLIQKLTCAIQADAHVKKDKFVEFCFTKQRKSTRLINLLKELSINYRDYSTEHKDRYYIEYQNIPSTVWLFLDPETKLYNNKIVENFGKPFYSELQHWDGLSTRKWGEWYYSQHQQNVDLVQAVMVGSGHQVNIGKDPHRISVSEKPYSLTTNMNKKRLEPQTVWCVKVSTSFFLARRNKQTFITGNCQNLPNVYNDPIGVRDCFSAPDGKTLIAVDFDSQELRIMAELSGDPVVIKMINEGLDQHLLNANAAFKLGLDDELLNKNHPGFEELKKSMKEQRNQGKVFSFATPYGASAKLIAESFNLEREEAQELLDSYWGVYVKTKEALDKAVYEAETNGYVQNFVGRKRRFEKNDYGKFKDSPSTQAFNFKIQSFGAELLRMATTNSYESYKQHPEWEAKIIMLVHDEAVIECKEEYAEEVLEETIKQFNGCWEYEHIELLSDGSIGKTYQECK